MKKFFNTKVLASNIIVTLLCIVIIVAPLVVDYSNLPKGFEVSKVFFVNAISGLMLLVYLVSNIIKIFRKRRLPDFTKMDVIILFMFVLSISLSSLLSAYPEIAYFGNTFRYQGFYTHLLLLSTGFVLYKTLRKQHLNYVLSAFLISGAIQAISGINQFVYFNSRNPNALDDGIWINGTFGQANWFVGRLLIVIFIAYFIFLKVNFRKNLSGAIYKFGSLITLVLSITALIFAFTRWGLVTFAVFTSLFLILQFPKLRAKNLVLMLTAFGIFALNLYVVLFNPIFDLHSQIPREIINVIKIDNYDPVRIATGYGFDTLGEVFKDREIFKGALIDRAHNFFFDLFVQGGLFLFGLIIFLIYFTLKKIRTIDERYFHLFLFLTLMWLFRSTIHESGIVNLLDFVILISTTVRLSQKEHSQI